MDNYTTMSPFFLLLIVSPLVGADQSLIKKTCKTTKHYDLCISSLKSNSNSSIADIRGLALIMIGVGMANATATSSYLSSQPASATKSNSNNNNSNSNDAVLNLKKAVLKECADKYMYAGDALEDFVNDVGMEEYDYASIHIAAAADYSNACHNAFRRNPAQLLYPPELARREDALKRICDVISGMIDLLIAT